MSGRTSTPGQVDQAFDRSLVSLLLSSRTLSCPGSATVSGVAWRVCTVGSVCEDSDEPRPIARGPFTSTPISSNVSCRLRFEQRHARTRKSISLILHMICLLTNARETEAARRHDATPADARGRTLKLRDAGQHGVGEHFFFSRWDQSGSELAVEHILGIPRARLVEEESIWF